MRKMPPSPRRVPPPARLLCTARHAPGGILLEQPPSPLPSICSWSLVGKARSVELGELAALIAPNQICVRPGKMAPAPLHDQLDIVIPTIRNLDFLEQWCAGRAGLLVGNGSARRLPRRA